MSANFEAIMDALLEHIQDNVPDFITVSRRLKHWAQVAEQPALFLRRVGTDDQYNGDLPITTLECEAWIFCNAGKDQSMAPDETLTGLENEVRDCLAPDDDMRFTLGGLVYWCRIEGKSDISSGDQGPQAIARLPVRITIP